MTSENSSRACMVLRLAAPLQSWGSTSQYNQRETAAEPTKSAILGLLAAADGRRRQDPIEDLLQLELGVRTDQPGTLLRDYHTVSDYRGGALLSSMVNRNGKQIRTSPAKFTHVTARFYLQDAVFVAAISGPTPTITGLARAVQRPTYPLALGRRACVPTQPVQLRASADDGLWEGSPLQVLTEVPWQASAEQAGQLRRRGRLTTSVDLPVTVDDEGGDDLRADVPHSFAPQQRAFVNRRVRNTWVQVPCPFPGAVERGAHDPFALLGW